MTKEEHGKITAFVADIGFEHTSDLMSLTAIIEDAIEKRREIIARREARDEQRREEIEE